MNRFDAFLFLTRCLSSGDHRDRLAEEIAAGRVCWERVIEIASHYWMTLALYQELREKRLLDLLPGDLLDYFASIHEGNRVRNRGILKHAGELAGMLNRIGVEPILLKGAGHLASGLYRDPAARFMSDIDILVPNDRALDCWRLLVSSGYRTAAARAGERVECMALQHLPELWCEGHTGGLELHRPGEWPHMLSSPLLYLGTEPIALSGARAHIPSATTRLIFAIAHSYVLHEVRRRPAMPVRDLYDATLLLRRYGSKIAWHEVIDAFHRGGETEAFRIGCMMWRLHFSPGLPGAIDPPRYGWIYRQRARLTVQQPGIAQVCSELARNASSACSNSAEGKRIRRKFFTPSIVLRSLRSTARLFRAGPPENTWR